MKSKIDIDEKFELRDDPDFHDQVLSDLSTAILFGFTCAITVVYLLSVLYQWIES